MPLFDFTPAISDSYTYSLPFMIQFVVIYALLIFDTIHTALSAAAIYLLISFAHSPLSSGSLPGLMKLCLFMQSA